MENESKVGGGEIPDESTNQAPTGERQKASAGREGISTIYARC